MSAVHEDFQTTVFLGIPLVIPCYLIVDLWLHLLQIIMFTPEGGSGISSYSVFHNIFVFVDESVDFSDALIIAEQSSQFERLIYCPADIFEFDS